MYTDFRRRKTSAPTFNGTYSLVDKLIEVCPSLEAIFHAPIETHHLREIRRFLHQDNRIKNAVEELSLYLGDYQPTNVYEERIIDGPIPLEIINGSSNPLKKVLDYAIKDRRTLYVDG